MRFRFNLPGWPQGVDRSRHAGRAVSLFTNNVSVLLGNGDGSFRTGQTYSVGANDPEFLSVGDFNGDGLRDLVIANFESSSVSVLISAADSAGGSPPSRQDPHPAGCDHSISSLLPEDSLSAGSLGQD